MAKGMKAETFYSKNGPISIGASGLDDQDDSNSSINDFCREIFDDAINRFFQYLDTGNPEKEDVTFPDGTTLDRLILKYVHQDDDRLMLELIRVGKSHRDIATIIGFPRKQIVFERLFTLMKIIKTAFMIEKLRPKHLPIKGDEIVAWELYTRGVRLVDIARQLYPDMNLAEYTIRKRLKILLNAIRKSLIENGLSDYLQAAEEFRQANSGFRTGGGGRPSKRAEKE